MSQAFVSVKNLAAYCLDYARLIAPTLQRSSVKTDVLDKDILNCEPLFDQIQSDEKLIIPFNLSLKTAVVESADDPGINPEPTEPVSTAKSETDNPDSEEHARTALHLKIAQQLEDLNRKYLTASFTKELRLEFGFIRFTANKVDQSTSKEIINQPLFSLPVQIRKTDHAGQRTYELAFSDEIAAINLSFLNSYLLSNYCDQLFTAVAIGEGQSKNVLPIDAVFLDELWSQIKHFLALSDATNISDTIDVEHAIISLQPRSNYFLSQDLQNLSELDELELQDTALSAWTSDEQMSINQVMNDNGSQELFFPFKYDKWQLQVLGILDNKAAIIEGPPGTGKSQTIANVLCHIAASGKTVLFVSQKDQAVRGVKDTHKTLDIASLYGYIPDRNSTLHSEEDEIDSASHSLVSLAREWAEDAVDNPVTDLQRASSLKPHFNESIDQDRTLYAMYDQLHSLKQYDFDTSTVSLAWWEEYIASVKAITKLQTIVSDYGPKHTNYITEHDQLYAVVEIEPKLVFESIKQTITELEQHAFDRSGFKRTLKDIKLKQAVRRATYALPYEIFETIQAITLSDETKAARRAQLMLLHNYFVFRYERELLDFYITKRQELLATVQVSVDDVGRLETLVAEQPAASVFSAIEKRRELHQAIRTTEKLNTNQLRAEIMNAQQLYASDTAGYIRNRINVKLTTIKAQKSSRAVLERIARSLNKSKRAFKTFDRLKSNPENFTVMSSVVPIWMMSLDDASRILPMQKNLFDYVIVDESSQCNIAYALPVMYRSKHILFFGDTLQMRDSTTLFKTNEQLNAIALKHGISDEYQIKATEDSVKSVMDIASLAGFQKTTLQYHYRSPKELIGFSNEYIYKKNGCGLQVINDNCLVYKDSGRVMINHLVEARPDMDVSEKTNIAEAFYIKRLIKDMRADPATKDLSIAVLAFFNEQAELLRQVIEDPLIKVAIIDGIQGDERDIIIYSFVITSPDQKNRYVALTGEGGEQRKESNEGRINVAFSRAKLQVHAVTSLQPYLWPEGIWIKKYLSYIDEFGVAARQHQVQDQQFDSLFEHDVYDYLAKTLSATDYVLRTQVKSCGFFIDLVMQHKKTGKRLAVECDGPTHFEQGDGQVYVANDYERESILMTAGWRFYHISYFDWQEDRGATEQIFSAYINDYFKIKPTVQKMTHQDEAPMHTPLVASSVDIPAQVVDALKSAKAARKSRFI
jgi:very-short-patch-repair endonuclease